jgi:hypothetical protein
MNIDQMTIGELKQIQQLIGQNKSGATAFEIGKSYLIRTVTNFYTGRLTKIFDHELVLEKSAWIADTGRYYDALKKGTLNEVEPIIGDCIVSRGSIVDAVIWTFDLPEVQK